MNKDLVKKKYLKKIKELSYYNKRYFDENISDPKNLLSRKINYRSLKDLEKDLLMDLNQNHI